VNDATLNYVRQHSDDDVRLLALRGCKDTGVDLSMALQQIQGRQTARRKLPSWAALEGIVYPPHLNLEQCSSELTARYKASVAARLVAGIPSPSLIDLTGGFGVDFAFMADVFSQATYVEQNPQLFAISSANIQQLVKNVKNVKTMNTDGIGFFYETDHVTMVYLDPARRDGYGARTYAISDCTPDVLAVKDLLLQKADYVMLKLSPMLDWRKAVSDLGETSVREVHIVAVDNECKELLLVLSNRGERMPVYCINGDQQFRFDALASPSALHPCCNPSSLSDWSGKVLCEPNAAIMKAGCFSELAHSIEASPLSTNSHLFVADHPVEGFPGRQFVIDAVTTLNKRDLRQSLGQLTQANITTRNFPLSVADLRRRLKLQDGGSTYIFATTLADGQHVLLICHK
jgi:hypothetical protein